MPQMAVEQVDSLHWPVLEPIEGERERSIALSKPVCVAGDRSRVNLTLPSVEVSRAHALFVADEDGVYVRDLASRNHTYVNAEPIRETRLDNGDVIRIGPYAFRCQRGFPADGTGGPRVPDAELFVEGSGTAIPLRGRTAVIGTRRECDIRVTDEAVEPVHAVMFEQHGAWHVRALRASKGVFVNDELVGQVELQLGDRIRVGKTTLRYTRPAEPTKPELPEIPLASAADLSLASEVAKDDSVAPLDQISLEPLDREEAQEELIPSEQGSAVIPQVAEPRELGKDVEETGDKETGEEKTGESSGTSSIRPVQPEGSPDDSLIPLADESPVRPPQISAASPSESFPQSGDESVIPIKEEGRAKEGTEKIAPAAAAAPSAATELHPGQDSFDRAVVEENLDELIDELAENVGEIQTTWEQLKATEEPPGTASRPGADKPGDEGRRNRKTSDDSPRRKRPANPTSN